MKSEETKVQALLRRWLNWIEGKSEETDYLDLLCRTREYFAEQDQVGNKVGGGQ